MTNNSFHKTGIYVYSFSCVLVLLTWYSSTAQQQSHYDAAHDLMEIIQENSTEEVIDSIIDRIVTRDNNLEEHRDEISSIIQRYLRTREYRETRIKIIMHYFTEPEIRDVCRIVRCSSFHNATEVQIALMKRYEKMFNKLEALFIEYVRNKLRRKY